MEITQYIQLPDGTYAALVRSMSYGDVVLILLLVPMLVMLGYVIWIHRPPVVFVTVAGHAEGAEEADEAEAEGEGETAKPAAWWKRWKKAQK